MDNKDNKRGFSGLSDLASDVNGADDLSGPEPTSPHPKPAHRRTVGNVTEHKAFDSLKPIKTMGSGKSVGGSGWKWILGIIAVIFVIWLANKGGQNTQTPSYNPTPSAPRSYDNQSTRSTLAREIENGKIRAKQMETQIKDMNDRLEDYEREMRSYRASGMTDEYNMLVPTYNSLVSERNELYEEYSRLIDEVNAKVKRYNSGYR